MEALSGPKEQQPPTLRPVFVRRSPEMPHAWYAGSAACADNGLTELASVVKDLIFVF